MTSSKRGRRSPDSAGAAKWSHACAPFPRKALQPSEIDKGIDPATELPAIFSARRLRMTTAQGIKPEAARLLLRAEARTGKGDKPGAMKALEQATAIERHKKILAVNPNEPVALNNLAYALAVRKG